MAISDRNLSAGTKLWARYKGETHMAEVVEVEGALRYQLSDGRPFKSPSAAGTSITGKACNGWAFWSTGEPTEKPARPEQASRARGSRRPVHAVPKPERQGRSRKGREIPRDGNGHALPIVEQVDGTFECANCSASFPTREEAVAHVAEAHPTEQQA
jgi:hypothetical protein